MAEHNHHTEDQSANKSMTNKEDLDSSKAIDPPSNFQAIESSAQEVVKDAEQERQQVQWALQATIQENAALKERVAELQAKLADCLAAIEVRNRQLDPEGAGSSRKQALRRKKQRRYTI